MLKRQAIASRYVDGLVLRVRDEWRDALAYLLESGLDRAQVRAMVSSIDATTPLPWRGDIPSVGAATAMLVREWRIGNTELQRSLE